MNSSNVKQQSNVPERSAFSFKELAQSLGVSVRTLRTEAKAGRLSFVRIGRRVVVTTDQVEKYLARQSV